MNCFVCAREGRDNTAVAICQQCQVALCMEHLAEQQAYRPGGLDLPGCPHELPVKTKSEGG